MNSEQTPDAPFSGKGTEIFNVAIIEKLWKYDGVHNNFCYAESLHEQISTKQVTESKYVKT
jgi:hypothetical protein